MTSKADTTSAPLASPPRWGWVGFQDGTVLHIVPTWDIASHTLDPTCACGWVLDEEVEHMVRHAAFDGREHYETGKRKRH